MRKNKDLEKFEKNLIILAAHFPSLLYVFLRIHTGVSVKCQTTILSSVVTQIAQSKFIYLFRKHEKYLPCRTFFLFINFRIQGEVESAPWEIQMEY